MSLYPPPQNNLPQYNSNKFQGSIASLYGVEYYPPNNLLPIFNDSEFSNSTVTSTISTTYLDANYLKYPTAQGTQNMLNTNVTGTLAVTGAATVSTTLGVTGNSTLNTVTMDSFNSTSTTNLANITGPFNVTGSSTLNTTRITQLNALGVGSSYTPVTSTGTSNYQPTFSSLTDGDTLTVSGIGGNIVTTFTLPTPTSNKRFHVFINNRSSTNDLTFVYSANFYVVYANGSLSNPSTSLAINNYSLCLVMSYYTPVATNGDPIWTWIVKEY